MFSTQSQPTASGLYRSWKHFTHNSNGGATRVVVTMVYHKREVKFFHSLNFIYLSGVQKLPFFPSHLSLDLLQKLIFLLFFLNLYNDHEATALHSLWGLSSPDLHWRSAVTWQCSTAVHVTSQSTWLTCLKVLNCVLVSVCVSVVWWRRNKRHLFQLVELSLLKTPGLYCPLVVSRCYYNWLLSSGVSNWQVVTMQLFWWSE